MSGKSDRRKGKIGRGLRKARGQAIVEFALVMIFFLVLLLAMLDLGRAYFTMVALENAAAEGALFGSGKPTCVGSSDCPDPDNIEYRVKHESTTGGLLNPGDISVEVTTAPGGPEIGTPITVTVSYPFHTILPFLSAFGADTITLRQTAIQMIP